MDGEPGLDLLANEESVTCQGVAPRLENYQAVRMIVLQKATRKVEGDRSMHSPVGAAMEKQDRGLGHLLDRMDRRRTSQCLQAVLVVASH